MVVQVQTLMWVRVKANRSTNGALMGEARLGMVIVVAGSKAGIRSVGRSAGRSSERASRGETKGTRGTRPRGYQTKSRVRMPTEA